MTDAEKKAKELLPCIYGCNEIMFAGMKHFAHSPHCPSGYRPAVAAALAERDAKIAELEKSNNDLLEAIDGALKDRDYYERLACENERQWTAEVERMRALQEKADES